MMASLLFLMNNSHVEKAGERVNYRHKKVYSWVIMGEFHSHTREKTHVIIHPNLPQHETTMVNTQ